MPVTVTVDHLAAVPEPLPDDALVAVGVRAGGLDEVDGLDPALAAAAGFTGEVAQTLVVSLADGLRLLVGLGADPDAASMRRAAVAAARAARAATVVVDALGSFEGAARRSAAEALAEGLVLGSYRFGAYKEAGDGVRPAAFSVVGKGGQAVGRAIERGVAVAAAITLVRDLVNTPGGDLTPVAFAAAATDVAADAGLEIEVLDAEAIAEARLGGLLGVNRGSSQPPRFVKLVHRPEGRPKARVALVGKGVTFDAGGLSIKTAKGMETMKTDMAGAATVLGAMSLVPAVAPKVEVTAYLPLTDNMLGGDATRVGDVLRARNGTTIEVLNTDAEGRLILADALSLAAEDEPDAIVDLATLTGACMVALGDRTAGVMGNHDGLRDRVLGAAADQDEAMWALPMPGYLRGQLDSDIADLRNIGTAPYGGASVAATFLREFVDGRPWVHLDIAGPSHTASAHGEYAKGGTGFGVRTLAALLASWTKLSPAEG
ncbi:MAG: leucyl aminopeptidase [Acidimicrobiales bacterium]|nr:leucyl aminopeptidase [Acidimicrobiales bacterium]